PRPSHGARYCRAVAGFEPLSKLTPLTLPALLALPPADAIPQPLRDAMLQVDGDPFAQAPDPPAVLADTLASLAKLGADGDVTAAAVLRALPAVEAQLRPRLDKEHPQIVALLEGQ